MHKTGKDFREAARDYIYLSKRGYSDKASLKLIGDRYQLSGTDRSSLFRGIFHEEINDRRKSKLCGKCQLDGSAISIDGFNVIYTIISYLTGKYIFISTDGLLRDAAEVHGKPYRESLRQNACRLMLEYLASRGIAGVSLYFDDPIPYSGDMAATARVIMADMNMEGTAVTVPSADHWVSNADEGLIATSDGIIIDNCQQPVIDLAAHVILHNFHPAFENFALLLQ